MSEGGVGHYLVVSGQDLGVLVSELLHEGGGTGQITEHEREGPHGQRVVVRLGLGEPLRHHTRQVFDQHLRELAG